MSLGENIKRIRKEKKMSQAELGEKVGLTRSQISNLESGKRSTTVDRQAKIAKALGISIADLYDGEEKIQLDSDGYAILTDELREEGIDPETARKWIRFAKRFIEENKSD